MYHIYCSVVSRTRDTYVWPPFHAPGPYQKRRHRGATPCMAVYHTAMSNWIPFFAARTSNTPSHIMWFQVILCGLEVEFKLQCGRAVGADFHNRRLLAWAWRSAHSNLKLLLQLEHSTCDIGLIYCLIIPQKNDICYSPLVPHTYDNRANSRQSYTQPSSGTRRPGFYTT